eukprot:CAMPEP_0118948536 /NCGR_PEP_ID=MMETSP1169-20130426/48016_1 /TAXON_ID=36882 /ORGANISM="Pyramimonas obovata, Strain CCMP722" /LENGTH=216 /DNA_ID=CAMNT_0006894999 /DNA_START=165 /DNA_END=812 /DNA_ORIENTATION=-
MSSRVDVSRRRLHVLSDQIVRAKRGQGPPSDDIEDVVPSSYTTSSARIARSACSSCGNSSGSCSSNVEPGGNPHSLPSPALSLAPTAASTSTDAVVFRHARIQTDTDYIRSLRGRKLKVYMFGELVPEFVDHPIIRPSINAVAETYRLAQAEPDLASACSSISGVRCSRFLHVTETVEDVVKQGLMQRKLGQITGTCFQRCVGMDAINSTFSITYE